MKTVFRLSIAIVLLVSGFASIAEPGVPSVPGIDSNNARWQAAMNRSLGDGQLRALYTENAIMVPPSQAILPEADFTEFLNSYIRTHMADFQLQPVSLHTDGNRAYQSAVWMATINQAGRAREIDGELTNIFLRQTDGSWKIEFQSWN